MCCCRGNMVVSGLRRDRVPRLRGTSAHTKTPTCGCDPSHHRRCVPRFHRQGFTSFNHLHGAFNLPSAALGVWDEATCMHMGGEGEDSQHTQLSTLLPLRARGVYTLFAELATADGLLVVPHFTFVVGDAATPVVPPPVCDGVTGMRDAVAGARGYDAGDPGAMGRMQPPGVITPPSMWESIEWNLDGSHVFSWDGGAGTGVVVVDASSLAVCVSGTSADGRVQCLADKLVATLNDDALVRARVCLGQHLVSTHDVATCKPAAAAIGAAAFRGVLGSQAQAIEALQWSDDEATAARWAGAGVDLESVLRQTMSSCGATITCEHGCVAGAVTEYASELAQMQRTSRLPTVCDELVKDSPSMWIACVRGGCGAGHV